MSHRRLRSRSPRRRSVPARSLAVLALLGAANSAPAAHAQELSDPARLAGVAHISVRGTTNWDELITMNAGGATADQFRQAIQIGLQDAIRAADAGPLLNPTAPNYLECHVDTQYETGLIVFSVRVSHHEPDADGRHVITWLDSWVGSYPTRQLHLMWTLADQCAKTFLDAWVEAG